MSFSALLAQATATSSISFETEDFSNIQMPTSPNIPSNDTKIKSIKTEIKNPSPSSSSSSSFLKENEKIRSTISAQLKDQLKTICPEETNNKINKIINDTNTTINTNHLNDTKTDILPNTGISMKPKLRSGKWTPQEEAYAQHLIEDFTNGILEDVNDGVTMRSWLAKQLNCCPMRISKKFVGSHSIGKRTFKKNNDCNANDNIIYIIQHRQDRFTTLQRLKKEFLDAVKNHQNITNTSGLIINGHSSIKTNNNNKVNNNNNSKSMNMNLNMNMNMNLNGNEKENAIAKLNSDMISYNLHNPIRTDRTMNYIKKETGIQKKRKNNSNTSNSNYITDNKMIKKSIKPSIKSNQIITNNKNMHTTISNPNQHNIINNTNHKIHNSPDELEILNAIGENHFSINDCLAHINDKHHKIKKENYKIPRTLTISTSGQNNSISNRMIHTDNLNNVNTSLLIASAATIKNENHLNDNNNVNNNNDNDINSSSHGDSSNDEENDIELSSDEDKPTSPIKKEKLNNHKTKDLFLKNNQIKSCDYNTSFMESCKNMFDVQSINKKRENNNKMTAGAIMESLSNEDLLLDLEKTSESSTKLDPRYIKPTII